MSKQRFIHLRTLLAVLLALVIGFGMDQAVHLHTGSKPALRAADGGHVIVAPPPGMRVGTPHGNPFGYRYVKPYYAHDLLRFNLSTPINNAAHHYGLSPVGLLSVVLAECAGNTHSAECDRVVPPYDVSFGCCQITVSTAAQFGVGNGIYDGYYGRNVSYVRTYENDAKRGIWLAARVLRHMRDVTGARLPELDVVWNCGSAITPAYGTVCYSNHQHYLAWLAVAATYAANSLRTVGNGYALLDRRVIQRKLWHLKYVTSVIESGYAYESGLTGGIQPVADQDALTGGLSERVNLPGNRNDKYRYFGCIPIWGSGAAKLYAAPNGGRFALLHLRSCATGVSAEKPYTYRGKAPAGTEDATGLAVSAFLSGAPRAGYSVVRGDSFVGYSGWPSSYEYSNGSCDSDAWCRSVDSHLCTVTTLAAQNWLLRVAQRRPPKKRR